MTASEQIQVPCDYCGLPIFSSRNRRRGDDGFHDPEYCCLGCRVAAQLAGPRDSEEHAHWTLVKVGFAIFFSMNVMVFTLVLWSSDLYIQPDAGRAALLYELYRYVCLIFTLPVLMMLGSPLWDAAVEDIRSRRISTSLLLAVGVAAAFAYSAISVLRGAGQVYFEIVCMVLVAVTIGRWLEATGKRQTSELLSGLAKLLPDTVRLVHSNSEELIPLAQANAGDRFRVLPGERIPLDGRIVRNLGAIDEQTVTGESIPAIKEPGDEVFSGTLNLDGDLTIEATAPASAGTLERIVSSVLEAAAQKDRYGKLADRVSALFVPSVLAVIAATVAIHLYQGQAEKAWLSALAVALIACPCALALATPLAIWTTLGKAAQQQVLLQNSDALNFLACVKTICFDKTGTITTGQPTLTSFIFDPATPCEELLGVAAAISQGSSHPLAKMVYEVAAQTGAGPMVNHSRTIPGRGVEAEVVTPDGQLLHPVLGSLRMMRDFNLALPDDLSHQAEPHFADGCSIVCLGWDGIVRAIFTAREELRPDAQTALSVLRQQGIRLVMLTGDNIQRAELLANELGIEAYGELLPDDKVALIKQFKAEGGPVIMVGEGINDAPALAAADAGIALGCGTDLSRHSSDLCLLGNQLERLPWVIALTRETVRTIRWNLLWAMSYNTLGIVIAAVGWLNPIIAAAAMLISSLLVISNSMRLRHWQFETSPPELLSPAASPLSMESLAARSVS